MLTKGVFELQIIEAFNIVPFILAISLLIKAIRNIRQLKLNFFSLDLSKVAAISITFILFAASFLIRVLLGIF